MTAFLFWALCVACIAVLLSSAFRKDGPYQTPFLLCGTVVGFVLPQAYGLLDDVTVPEGALDMLLVMSLLCVAAIVVGNRLAMFPFRWWAWEYNERNLLLVATGLTLVGSAFQFALSRLPDGTEMGTGLPVALVFFGNLLPYGLAIAMLLLCRTGTRWALVVVCLGSILPFYRIVFHGRRHVLFGLVFTVLLSLWFGRGRALPRSVMLVGVLLGALLIFSTGAYRQIMATEGGPQWSDLSELSPVDTFQENVLEKGGTEVKAGAFAMLATEIAGEYDLGTSHWNGLVLNYVPAQIVGSELKQELMFEHRVIEAEVLGYEKHSGSTYTGFTHAFRAFGYFGCLEYLVIAYIMAKLYRTAVQGHFVAQVVYIVSVVPAMHTVTHSTQRFPSFWVHVGVFLLPLLYLARRSEAARTAHSRSVTTDPLTTVRSEGAL